MFRNFEQVLDDARKLETKDLIVVKPEDRAILIAINDAFQMGLIRPVLVGDKLKILDLLMDLGIRKDGYEIYNAIDSKDASFMSVKLANKQENAILMKGHCQSRVFLEELLNKDYGLTTDRLISHIGVLDIPSYHKLLFISDSVMNINPTKEMKRKITDNTIQFVKSLGIFKPKVAMISAIEEVNDKIESSVHAEELVKELREQDNYYIGGPFSVDVAISHESAKTKDINHVVAGDSDILIFPNIESANTFYKSAVFLANAVPAGLLLGARSPVVLTSRSDSYKSKLYSIALGVVSTDIV
jgi:phosphate butyryltransferase